MDTALAKAAHLDACGISPHVAKLLYTKPWCEEAMVAAIVEVVIIEWQARKVVGHDDWTSPIRHPEALFGDAAANYLEVPPVLRRSNAAKFPRTRELLNCQEPHVAYTDGRGEEYFHDLADASILPGTCWQWLGGWRLEADNGNGWIYGDCEQLFFRIFSHDELDLDMVITPETEAPLRCRKWRRTRALARVPSLLASDPKSNRRNKRACLIASKYLELRCHGASLTILATKLSDQLVATRKVLFGAEHGVKGDGGTHNFSNAA